MVNEFENNGSKPDTLRLVKLPMIPEVSSEEPQLNENNFQLIEQKVEKCDYNFYDKSANIEELAR